MPKRRATSSPWASRTCAPAAKHEGIKWSLDAKQLALQFGQNDLAAAIDRDLAALKQQ